MKQGKVDSGTLWAWVTAALAAPFAQCMGSVPWPWALGLTLGAGALFLCAESVTSQGWHCGKVLAGAEVVLLLLVASAAADQVSRCWEGARITWCFSAVLLALAALSAEKGCNAAGRCGATLLWLVGAGFVVLSIFSLPDTMVENLYPGSWCRESGQLLAVLLPGAALLLPREKGKNPWQWVLIWVLGAGVIAILSAGGLSPWIAGQTDGAFLEMLGGAQLFGVAQRMDALAASIITVSWFCLLTLLLSAVGKMGGNFGKNGERLSIWIGGGAAFAAKSYAGKLPAITLAVGALILWIIVPSVKSIAERRWGGERTGNE